MPDLKGLIKRRDTGGRTYYCYQYRDSSGIRHTKSLRGMNLAQAKAVVRELERKKLEGKLGVLDHGKLSLEQFTRIYLQNRKAKIALGGRTQGGLSSSTG